MLKQVLLLLITFLNVELDKKTMELMPPKGTRDFPPEIKILRDEIFRKIVSIFERYGFVPIETPVVERWDILKGKYGEEAESRLIWRFKLPYSEKEYALRYDLTVPLARFFARFNPKLPFKRYQIGRVYRYENPQKGRYREFYQCDADILGAEEPFPDIEIIDMMSEVFDEFKIPKYLIKLNDRRVLNDIFEKRLGIKNADIMLKIFRSVDKLDKIGKSGVLAELEKMGLPKDKIEYISKILETSEYANKEVLEFLERFSGEGVEKGRKLLENILDYSKVKNSVKIDLSLVRGLDYYTGMIFEIVVEKPRIGSLSGGGRYDNLIGMFINKQIPAVGGTVGVERLIEAGIENGIFKIKECAIADAGVIALSDSAMKYALKVAHSLRKNGVNTYMIYRPTSPVKGIKHLEKRKIKYAVLIGEEEVKEKTFTLQNLETRERDKYKLSEIVKATNKILS